ncbi:MULTISPECIES: TOMM precursor leader peptide-binding protein [Sorangium]|uniref:TOMM precursor leader peptide-binding protein n=1 Tax=Sorangium TaxID=39643 RepID=UPI0002ED087A|nr:TOMM precursor leader peptide-binding protein [Sorangium cellulosum]
MPSIRLSRSASITPTDVGVILRSDLGSFQLTGLDVSAFVERMVPLLDGSRDREALVEALADYSRQSVTAFLDLLEARGLVEPVPDHAPSADGDRLRGQREFLRKWSSAPEQAAQRIANARVLVVGLEPWGASAALALAGAGVSALRLIDGGAVGPRDVAVVRARGEAALGGPRRGAVAALIREHAPLCRVDESSSAALEGGDLLSPEGRPHLLVAAVRGDDAELLERVARFGHRAGIASLFSHLAGTTAVLGPLVFPGKTACRICATTEALNPSLAARSLAEPAPHAGTMGQLLGHLVAMEALKVLSAYTPSRLGGRFLIQDLATLETSHHTLVRLPWCKVCGEG